MVNLEVSAFSEMFQKHRNLIVGAINKDLDKVLVETQDDWKSAPQFVMRITAPDVDSWVKVFNMQAETLKEKFDENERERFMTFSVPMYPLLTQKLSTMLSASPCSFRMASSSLSIKTSLCG